MSSFVLFLQNFFECHFPYSLFHFNYHLDCQKHFLFVINYYYVTLTIIFSLKFFDFQEVLWRFYKFTLFFIFIHYNLKLNYSFHFEFNLLY